MLEFFKLGFQRNVLHSENSGGQVELNFTLITSPSNYPDTEYFVNTLIEFKKLGVTLEDVLRELDVQPRSTAN